VGNEEFLEELERNLGRSLLRKSGIVVKPGVQMDHILTSAGTPVAVP